MANGTTKIRQQKTSLVEELAENILRLPRRERETLEELLEEKFVATVLRRARQIPRLRKKGKLLTFDKLKQEFSR
mgnify:CR=1 FL=1